MIRQLKNQGLTISEISRKLSMDRKTVRSALKSDLVPKYERKLETSILDPFKNYIDTRLDRLSKLLQCKSAEERKY